MAARRPAGIILSGGPKSVNVEGAPRLDPAVYAARRPRARHLLRRPADRPAARRRGRPTPAGASTAAPRSTLTSDGPAPSVLFGAVPPDVRRVDEPLRRHLGPRRPASGRRRRPPDSPVAALEDSGRGDLRRAVPPRGGAHPRRPGDAQGVPLRRVRVPAGVDDDIGHRGVGRRPSGPRSEPSGSSAGCPAGWTRRWPPPWCTRRSATS